MNNEDLLKSNVIDLARDSEELSYLKQCDSSNISQAVNEASLKTSSTAAQERHFFPTNEEQDPSLGGSYSGSLHNESSEPDEKVKGIHRKGAV